MIHLSCIYCGKKLTAKDEWSGKRGRCPACNHFLRIVQKNQKNETNEKYQVSGFRKQNEKCWEKISDEEVAEVLLSETAIQEIGRRALKRTLAFLIPHYDNLTLFTFSLTFLFLLLISERLREDVIKVVAHGAGIILCIALMICLILSFFNVLFKREKYNFEKLVMLYFAVFVTVVTGGYSGFVMLEDHKDWLVIFPIWNIVNAGVLALLFRLGVIDFDCITDEPVTFFQILFSFIMIAVLLFFCHYVFKLHWSLTYSICVCYTMSFHRAIQDVFGRGPMEN